MDKNCYLQKKTKASIVRTFIVLFLFLIFTLGVTYSAHAEYNCKCKGIVESIIPPFAKYKNCGNGFADGYIGQFVGNVMGEDGLASYLDPSSISLLRKKREYEPVYSATSGWECWGIGSLE